MLQPVREVISIHMNDLGNANAVPVDKAEYDRMRAQSVAEAKLTKAAA